MRGYRLRSRSVDRSRKSFAKCCPHERFNVVKVLLVVGPESLGAAMGSEPKRKPEGGIDGLADVSSGCTNSVVSTVRAGEPPAWEGISGRLQVLYERLHVALRAMNEAFVCEGVGCFAGVFESGL